MTVEVLLDKMKKRGSSTVFLSLMFSVILMLIIAVIALLTYRSERVNIKRTLDISVESVFGKYYAPLFSDYGLFYYMETDIQAMQADIMYYFLENQKDTPRLLKLTPETLNISDKKYLVSNRSNIKQQMREAVVSKCGEKIISDFMDMYKDFSEESVNAEEVLGGVIDEVDTFKNDAQIEKDIMELITLVEGVRLSEGHVYISEYFAKKGVSGKASQSGVGIDSILIWNEVKDEYIDISELLDDLSKSENISDTRLKKWKDEINGIRNVTEKAYVLASELDSRMTDGQKKSSVCDVTKLEDLLSDNLKILDELAELSVQNMNDKVLVNQLMNMLKDYHIKDMYIDYSTYVNGKTDDPTENIDINPKGITSFLIGDKKISGLAVSEADIYSDIESSEGEADTFLNYREPNELSALIGELKPEVMTDAVGDMAAMGAYMKEYFSHFMEGEIDKEENRALEYELEYICSGKTSDAENLQGVIHKCLLIRTGQSLVYLLSDSGNKQKAYATAAALVGFTGMDALVRITQYMILTGWAYADACVDVAAMLDGGKINIIKNKRSFNVSYGELMSFGKEMIRKKSKEVNAENGIDYETAVLMFVMLKGDTAVSRSMDIIQNNMKLRDSRRFSFKDAVYGLTAEISCIYPYRMKASTVYSY